MLGAQVDKSILNVYNFQKDQIALKIVLPEKLTCFALDRSATYCAGGTSHGRVYIWEVASGILYNAWDAHYRQVNILKFTSDGLALISGSEDSGISVWSVSKLVDDGLKSELPLPQFTMSDHTLPITDIICGVGLFPKCRVLTASLDHTAKLWDLSTQSLISTFHFPKPISCIAWDIGERFFFAASASPDGSLHRVNLFRERDIKYKGKIIEAIGGVESHSVIHVNDEPEDEGKKRLITVGQAVTTLSISITTSLLLVGTTEGLIHLYDITSLQLLRTISSHRGMSITFLTTMIKPPDLIGHVSLMLNVSSTSDARDVMPVKPIAPLHRIKDMKAREHHEVTIMLPMRAETLCNPSHYDYPEFQDDYAFFVRPTNTQTVDPSSSIRVAELEEEVQSLREQLCKAKGINDAMWEIAIQKLLHQKNQTRSNGGSSDNVTQPSVEGSSTERSRKRMRP